MSPRSVRPLPRWLRIAVPVAILGILLLTVGTVGFVEYTSQSGFCNNCHIMEPYYQSWATSGHRDVACIECHSAPGIKAYAMTKLQAANMVVKYFTGAAGTRPWAQVEDASCLRAGCHSERLIEGLVEYKGVRFDHTDHLGELRHGIQLRCTSCHSQIVQGSHIAVTEGTCFLCHFKGRSTDMPLAGCTGCHPTPPRVVSPAGYSVDHAQYVKDRIDCLSCHSEVTTGAGTADLARCVSCHNEPERLAQFNDPKRLHQVHVADHDVPCGQCHTSIEHRVVALAGTVELDCKTCHANVHDAQRRMYAGFGGHGVADAPSSMFMARVSCLGCHAEATEFKGHERVQLAGEGSCLACHGIRFANMLPAWQRDIASKVDRVAAVVDKARESVSAVPLRQRATADSLVRLAEDNVQLVRVGKGAHNVLYTDGLLRASLALVREATQRSALPYSAPAVSLGPPLSDNACLQCHLGVRWQSGTFQGRPFSHAPHVARAALQCSTCHTNLDQHGGITLTSTASCNACHHPLIAVENCARCHAGPAGVPQVKFSLATGEFSHRPHAAANLACSACHTPPLMAARDLRCDNCHESHHQPDQTCLDCHKGGVLALHTRAAHAACAQCHASVPGLTHWSRQVCTACHADKVNHYPDQQCDVCHMVPPMGEPPS